MPDTAMSAALERAGLKKHYARFGKAAMEFLEESKSEEEAFAVVRQAAAKLRSRGIEVARTGTQASLTLLERRNPQSPREPFETERQSPRPPREPSEADRQAAASVANRAANTVKITVLQTYRLMDGRAIGEVRFGELARVGSASLHNFYVVKQIQQHAIADHDQLVRDIIKPEQLQRFIQRAAEMCDDTPKE